MCFSPKSERSVPLIYFPSFLLSSKSLTNPLLFHLPNYLLQQNLYHDEEIHFYNIHDNI